jgi:hypothetical protein
MRNFSRQTTLKRREAGTAFSWEAAPIAAQFVRQQGFDWYYRGKKK